MTDDCNLRCIYCFNYEKRKTRQCGGKEVNVRQLKEVMSQFKELGGTGVVFTGGEPTLNKSLIPLAKYAVELGLPMSFFVSRDSGEILARYRLSTIIGCDKIYVLENGTVVEAGNHNELIDKHGVYSEMLYQQKIINERNTI